MLVSLLLTVSSVCCAALRLLGVSPSTRSCSEECEVEFDELLEDVVGGPPSRRDRAVSFFQLLLLTQLHVLRVEQGAPYGDLVIQRGERWQARLSASQSF